MDFKRKVGFFENLSKEDKLEILFEDRKNMFRYIRALKEVLKSNDIKDFEEQANEFYKVLNKNI